MFQLGDRVRISPGYSWGVGAEGVIAAPPMPNGAPGGFVHVVRRRDGIVVTSYWVRFDSRVLDEDGHRVAWAAIEEEFLQTA